MYAILPLLIIFIGIAIILVLIIRKFPQLTLLDVDSIPEVKEEKKKDEFLKKRAEKKKQESQEKKKVKWDPIINMGQKAQSSFRSFFGNVEKKVFHDTFVRNRKKKIEQGITPEQEIPSLLMDATQAFKNQNYDLSEKKYIEIIRLAPKHIEAYRGLAEVYIKLGQTKEAEETFQFLHHLVPGDDLVLIRLAELAEEAGQRGAAISYYEKALLLNDSLSSRFAKLSSLLQEEKQYPAALEAMSQALELESENPKYLDNIIELAIMVDDKELAKNSLEKLRLVNPNNQKLPLFKEKIESLG